MRTVTPRAIPLAVIIGFGLASSMFGGNNCNTGLAPSAPCFGITAAGPTGNHLAGVYTDPYQATGGSSVLAFCDDYFDDVNPPESWNVLVTNLNAFKSGGPVQDTVYYGDPAYSTLNLTASQQTTDYIAVAVLAVKSLQTGDATQAADTIQNQISYALWGVFDPSLLESGSPLGPADLTAANNYLSAALTTAATYVNDATASLSAGQAYENDLGCGSVTTCSTPDNIYLYTPTVNGTLPQLPGQTVSNETSRPQEFLTVSSTPTTSYGDTVPEASSWAMLAVDLIGGGLFGLVFFWCRRPRTRF